MSIGFGGKMNIPHTYGDDYNLGFELVFSTLNVGIADATAVYDMSWEIIHPSGDLADPDVYGTARIILDSPLGDAGHDKNEEILSVVSGLDIQAGDLMNFDFFLNEAEVESDLDGWILLIGLQPIFTTSGVSILDDDYNRK